MTIEEEIFQKTKINETKLKEYGFKDNKFTKKIHNNKFQIELEYSNNQITGKVIDLSFNEEYTNYKLVNETTSFAGTIKEEYLNLLKDIKKKCTQKEYFIYNQTKRITKKIIKKYKVLPEFPFAKNPNCGAFKKKNKWFGLIMNINKNKLTNEEGNVEVINLKLEERMISNLIYEKGFYKAYHMNKKNWISIILDDTIDDEIIMILIEQSYNLIK